MPEEIVKPKKLFVFFVVISFVPVKSIVPPSAPTAPLKVPLKSFQSPATVWVAFPCSKVPPLIVKSPDKSNAWVVNFKVWLPALINKSPVTAVAPSACLIPLPPPLIVRLL